MNCPDCTAPCWRDEVDVGLGFVYGPWSCTECGWAEIDCSDDDLAELDFS